MRGTLWVSLVVLIISVIMILLSGMYNPESTSAVLSPGEISAYSFTMHAGEQEKFTLRGTDYFTFYIMNSSSYNNLSSGNFTCSYYANTTREDTFVFTAPTTGTYYIVIANVNSRQHVEITLIYGSGSTFFLLLIGVVVALISFLMLIYSLMESRADDDYDSRCPHCGTPVKKGWKYCPNCRYELEER